MPIAENYPRRDPNKPFVPDDHIILGIPEGAMVLQEPGEEPVTIVNPTYAEMRAYLNVAMEDMQEALAFVRELIIEQHHYEGASSVLTGAIECLAGILLPAVLTLLTVENEQAALAKDVGSTSMDDLDGMDVDMLLRLLGSLPPLPSQMGR